MHMSIVFDVLVFNPFAQSCHNTSLGQCYHRNQLKKQRPMMREWEKLSTGYTPHWSSLPQAAWKTQPQSFTNWLPHSLRTSETSYTAKCCTSSDVDWVSAALFSSHGSGGLCWVLGSILWLKTMHAIQDHSAWILSFSFHYCTRDVLLFGVMHYLAACFYVTTHYWGNCVVTVLCIHFFYSLLCCLLL